VSRIDAFIACRAVVAPEAAPRRLAVPVMDPAPKSRAIRMTPGAIDLHPVRHDALRRDMPARRFCGIPQTLAAQAVFHDR